MIVAVHKLENVRFFSADGAVEWDPVRDRWVALGETPEPLRGLIREAGEEDRPLRVFPYPPEVGEGEAVVVSPRGRAARIRGDGTAAWVVQAFSGPFPWLEWLRQPMTPDGWLALPGVWVGPAGEVAWDPMLAWRPDGVAAGREVLLAGRRFRPAPGGAWTVEALPEERRLNPLYAGPEGILHVRVKEEDDEYGWRVEEFLEPAAWPGGKQPGWGPLWAHLFLGLPDGRWVGLTSAAEGWEIRVRWGDRNGPQGDRKILLEERESVRNVLDDPPALFPIPGGWIVRLGSRFLIRGPDPFGRVPVGLGRLHRVAGAVLATGNARWVPIPEAGASTEELAARTRPGLLEWVREAGGRSLVATQSAQLGLRFTLFPGAVDLPPDVAAADLAPDGGVLAIRGDELGWIAPGSSWGRIGVCPPGRPEGLRALPDGTVLVLTEMGEQMFLHRVGPDARPLGRIPVSRLLGRTSLARARVRETPGGIWVQPPGENAILVPPGEGLVPIHPVRG